MRIMKARRIGTMGLASALCAPAFADGRHAWPNPPAGIGRASFTAGDYSIQEHSATPATLLMRAEVRAELRTSAASARAAHEIETDLHG
jgi:hypothetical protein